MSSDINGTRSFILFKVFNCTMLVNLRLIGPKLRMKIYVMVRVRVFIRVFK